MMRSARFPRILKAELLRAFSNHLFFIALAGGCAITLSEIVTSVLPVIELQEQGLYMQGYPFSTYGVWIGGQPALFQTELYYFILPLLVCVPFADSLHTDVRSGHIDNLITRVSRRDYYIAKTLAIFLSAAVVGLAPLALNLYITSLFLPLLQPIVVTGQYVPVERTMWAELFYFQPHFYVGLYLLITFVFSGLLALIAMVLSFRLSNRFMVLLAPFVICLLLGFLLTGLQSFTRIDLLGMVSPIYFLNPMNVCFEPVQYAILAELIIFLVVVAVFVITRIRQNSVL
jgi:hypothetical protein